MTATTQADQWRSDLLDSVFAVPGGEKIRECIQCGTCSASCPAGAVMERSPRWLIAALRAGMLDRVLDSNTVWLCISCYSCTVRCPAGIPFTDIMYELKRLEAEGRISRGVKAATMAQAFVETVARHGRNSETKLLRKYYWRTNPVKALTQLPLVWKLFSRGRLEMRPGKIKGLDGLHKMMAAVEENGKHD